MWRFGRDTGEYRDEIASQAVPLAGNEPFNGRGE